MTRRLFASFGATALLACLTAALPSTASAQTNRISVTVPFDFQMSGTAMPAGKYIFETPINGGMVYLTSVSTGERHAAISMPVGNPGSPKQPQVVFERVGDRYRLAELWANGGSAGSGIRQTRSEQEYAKQYGKGTLIALSIRR